MSQSNGTSLQARAAAVLRELRLTPTQAAAVGRLETHAMYYTDQPLLEALADEMTPANRRVVERALRASWYHPIPDKRPPVAPELLQRIAGQADVVEAARLAADAALEARVLAAQAVAKAQSPDQQERWLAALRMAQEEHRLAHEALERATSLLTDLYRGRDERSRAAMLDAHTAK